MAYLCGSLAVVVAAFIVWRYTSVARGARQRDDRLFVALDPIAQKLAKKEPVAVEEIVALTDQPQYRPLLHQLLKHYERLDLFPADALSIEAQGAGILCYWMMHPNELQDAPQTIELVDTLDRTVEGERCKFLVYRYRMPPGHWAEQDGWMLGVAGPFVDNDVPYSGLAAGFSRCGDKFGQVQPAELVDWFIGMATRKSK